jgi:hypothetical protein
MFWTLEIPFKTGFTVVKVLVVFGSSGVVTRLSALSICIPAGSDPAHLVRADQPAASLS